MRQRRRRRNGRRLVQLRDSETELEGHGLWHDCHPSLSTDQVSREGGGRHTGRKASVACGDGAGRTVALGVSGT